MDDCNCIELKNTGILNQLLSDYLNQKTETKQLYQYFPSWDKLSLQAEQKLKSYANRDLLVHTLTEQNTLPTKQQLNNLEKLGKKNAVTITTGHQLNLFGGPMYLIYKILEVVKICNIANQKQKNYHFVPIFWMATEDHDFKEVNHFYYHQHKISWHSQEKGAVGRFSTKGIAELEDEFFNLLPNNKYKKQLQEIFNQTYLQQNTYSNAMRFLVNSLLGEYGILILDADNAKLKHGMAKYFKEDLLQHTAQNKVAQTNEYLNNKQYKTQALAREVNLFYLNKGKRERIIQQNSLFKVLGTNLEFSEDQILKELENHPERFSPNVILRPLYQEVILPNIAYVGGGGEIAYWLQLKSFFDSQQVDFPMLVVRNSLLIQSKKNHNKQKKLTISYPELFMPLQQLIKQKVQEQSTLDIDFNAYHNQIKNLFSELKSKANQTDKSFNNMVLAQEKKQLNGLKKMQRRMVKAELRKHQDLSQRITNWHQHCFPNHHLQERSQNFSVFWAEYGNRWIKEVYNSIQPLESKFCAVVIEP